MIGNVSLGKRDFEPLEIGYVFHQDVYYKGYEKKAALLWLNGHFPTAYTEFSLSVTLKTEALGNC